MASTGISKTRHAANFASPEAACVDQVFGVHSAVFGNHIPAAVGALVGLDNAVAQFNFSTKFLRGLGIGDGGAGGVDMPRYSVVQTADKVGLVDQRQQFLGFARCDDSEIGTVKTGTCRHHLQPVHTVFVGR